MAGVSLVNLTGRWPAWSPPGLGLLSADLSMTVRLSDFTYFKKYSCEAPRIVLQLLEGLLVTTTQFLPGSAVCSAELELPPGFWGASAFGNYVMLILSL